MKAKPNKIEFIDKNILCEYGCGNIAKYRLRNGKSICDSSSTKCPINRAKNSDGLKLRHAMQPEWKSIAHLTQWQFNNRPLSKEARAKATKTRRDNISSGKTKASWTGRHHKIESRQKISRAMQAFSNGFVKTKYFEIFCPYQKKSVKVQGTWELAYATYLNENKINWVHSRKLHLKYRWNDDDYEHLYYPDFYLPDTDEFIEIKGFFFKSKDGKIDDRVKMQKVQEQNKDIKITILMKNELKALGINVH